MTDSSDPSGGSAPNQVEVSLVGCLVAGPSRNNPSPTGPTPICAVFSAQFSSLAVVNIMPSNTSAMEIRPPLGLRSYHHPYSGRDVVMQTNRNRRQKRARSASHLCGRIDVCSDSRSLIRLFQDQRGRRSNRQSLRQAVMMPNIKTRDELFIFRSLGAN